MKIGIFATKTVAVEACKDKIKETLGVGRCRGGWLTRPTTCNCGCGETRGVEVTGFRGHYITPADLESQHTEIAAICKRCAR